MLAFHCDRDGCDAWARRDGAAGGQFLIVTDGLRDTVGHFCTLDCCMKWCAAHSVPTEEVPL